MWRFYCECEIQRIGTFLWATTFNIHRLGELSQEQRPCEKHDLKKQRLPFLIVNDGLILCSLQPKSGSKFKLQLDRSKDQINIGFIFAGDHHSVIDDSRGVYLKWISSFFLCGHGYDNQIIINIPSRFKRVKWLSWKHPELDFCCRRFCKPLQAVNLSSWRFFRIFYKLNLSDDQYCELYYSNYQKTQAER